MEKSLRIFSSFMTVGPGHYPIVPTQWYYEYVNVEPIWDTELLIYRVTLPLIDNTPYLLYQLIHGQLLTTLLDMLQRLKFNHLWVSIPQTDMCLYQTCVWELNRKCVKGTVCIKGTSSNVKEDSLMEVSRN